jgi:hypothetical protein
VEAALQLIIHLPQTTHNTQQRILPSNYCSFNMAVMSGVGGLGNTHTCVGPGMQERTLSMFSVVTSTSSTATRSSPEEEKKEVNA